MLLNQSQGRERETGGGGFSGLPSVSKVPTHNPTESESHGLVTL